MERDGEELNERSNAAAMRVSGKVANGESRPDWDPYAVWLTHIMQTPKSERTEHSLDEPDNPTESSAENADGSWNPYSVWQSLIKN